MRDVVLILAVIAFFAICVAFVVGCDKIIGPDEENLAAADAAEAEPVAS